MNGIVEIAGPETFPLDQLARTALAATDDRRQVVADVHARYFGALLSDQTLLPAEHPRFAPTRFGDWLSRSLA
jgi:hypothetical protein